MGGCRNAIIALAILTPMLAGCGFRPLYGQRDSAETGASAEQMAAIRIVVTSQSETTDGEREGQLLRNQLVTRFNPRGEPVKPAYVLTINLTGTMNGLGHRKDGTATMGEQAMSATYLLTNVAGARSMSGASSSVVSANFLGPRYASISAERDAQSRAIGDLAEDITTQVAAYLNNPASRAPVSQTGVIAPSIPSGRYQILQPNMQTPEPLPETGPAPGQP
jgi:LPS-assembly lipoprotein